MENLQAVFKQLRQNEIRPDQVRVLCQTSGLRSFLQGKKLEKWALVGLGEEGVVVETIHRFKGLEADVVILVQDRLKKPRDYRLAAIGVSRARSQLFVLASKKVIQVMQTLPRVPVGRRA